MKIWSYFKTNWIIEPSIRLHLLSLPTSCILNRATLPLRVAKRQHRKKWLLVLGSDVSVSAQGTFIGRILLEPHRPQQVPVNSMYFWGLCSTEKPRPKEALHQGSWRRGRMRSWEACWDCLKRRRNSSCTVSIFCLQKLALSRVLKKCWIQRGIPLFFATTLSVSSPQLQKHLQKITKTADLTELEIDSCRH